MLALRHRVGSDERELSTGPLDVLDPFTEPKRDVVEVFRIRTVTKDEAVVLLLLPLLGLCPRIWGVPD